MNHKNKVAVATLVLGLSSCTNEFDLNKLAIREHLYPNNFKAELDNNLNFFRDGVGVDPQAKVPFDTVYVIKGQVHPQYYVNTTEIGLYLNILVEVEKAGNNAALERIAQVLTVLESTPTWKGLYFWPYNIIESKLQPTGNGIVPAVDNANLALALVGVAGAYIDSQEQPKQAIVQRIEALLAGQKPGWLGLHDKNRGLLHAGWNTLKDAPLSYHIDRKANESRLAPLWASLITRNEGHNAIPISTFENMELYTQSYQFHNKQYHPMLTWDGAYFQAMLPAIWLNEKTLIPDYRIIEDMTLIQMAYAMKQNIPMVSSSATVDDGYAAFGVPELSESKVRFNNKVAKANTGTPHALALSYMVAAETSVQALKALKNYYPNIESSYGWYDAIDHQGNMSSKILSLDQGMFVGAFLAAEINADVARYLEKKGYISAVRAMYNSFVPNNNNQNSNQNTPINLNLNLNFGDDRQKPGLWHGIDLPNFQRK